MNSRLYTDSEQNLDGQAIWDTFSVNEGTASTNKSDLVLTVAHYL